MSRRVKSKDDSSPYAWDRWAIPYGYHFRHWFFPEGKNGGTDPQLRLSCINGEEFAGLLIWMITSEWDDPIIQFFEQDGLTLSCFRFARGSMENVLMKVSQTEAARQVWTDEQRALLNNRAWIKEHNKDKDNWSHTHGLAKYEWLRRGWYQIARSPEIYALLLDYWDKHVLAAAWTKFKALGWTHRRGLALFARARNSSGTILKRAAAAAAARGGSEADQWEAAAAYYGGLSKTKARRVAKIRAKIGTETVHRRPQLLRDIAWQTTPALRQDGSKAPSPSDAMAGATGSAEGSPLVGAAVVVLVLLWLVTRK